MTQRRSKYVWRRVPEELIAKWNDMEDIRTLAQDDAFLDADTLDDEELPGPAGGIPVPGGSRF